MKKLLMIVLCLISMAFLNAAEAVRYMVLEASTAQQLSRRVEYYLRLGWKLAGPMRTQNNHFYQPIMKGEKK